MNVGVPLTSNLPEIPKPLPRHPWNISSLDRKALKEINNKITNADKKIDNRQDASSEICDAYTLTRNLLTRFK